MQSTADESKLFFVWKNYQRTRGGGKDRPHIYEDTTPLNHPLQNVMNPELLANHRKDWKPLNPCQALLYQYQDRGFSCCTSSVDQSL